MARVLKNILGRYVLSHVILAMHSRRVHHVDILKHAGDSFLERNPKDHVQKHPGVCACSQLRTPTKELKLKPVRTLVLK